MDVEGDDSEEKTKPEKGVNIVPNKRLLSINKSV